MKPSNSIECPVDHVIINEYKVRFIALQIFVLSFGFVILDGWIVPVLLVMDFSLRSFHLGSFSPLGNMADFLIRLSSVGRKPIDQAPKRFSAKIGLLLSTGILIAYFFNYTFITYSLVLVIAFFSFLESAFSFCVGCIIYTYSKRIFN